MGLTIAINGVTVWPDLTGMQSLNHTIKNHPMVILDIMCIKLASDETNLTNAVNNGLTMHTTISRLSLPLWKRSMNPSSTSKS